MYYLCFFALKYLVKYDINIVELCMESCAIQNSCLKSN